MLLVFLSTTSSTILAMKTVTVTRMIIPISNIYNHSSSCNAGQALRYAAEDSEGLMPCSLP